MVALPLKLARSLGNISPLTLCHRVGNAVNLVCFSRLHSDSTANLLSRLTRKHFKLAKCLLAFTGASLSRLLRMLLSSGSLL